MTVTGSLDTAVRFIWGIIDQFYNFPFPGTNIKIGNLFLAVLGIIFLYRTVLLKWLLGVGESND